MRDRIVNGAADAPSSVADKFIGAVGDLVAVGRLPPYATDADAYRLVARHLAGLGLAVPCEKSWRRNIQRLRVVWKSQRVGR
jgi:hypothetical protein